MDQNETIAAFHAGTDAGFTAIFKHFFKPLCFFANRMIKDKDASQDLVITALTAVMQRHARFEDFNSLQGYLYITVANKCRNEITYNKRHYKENSDDLDGNDYPAEHTVMNNIVTAELLKEITNEIFKLKPTCKRVLQMFYVEGKSNNEISQELNMPRTTVFMHKLRGIKRIQKILKIKKSI